MQPPPSHTLETHSANLTLPRQVLAQLTDAHCHPNDAFSGEEMGLAASEVCVMSSSLPSLDRTEELFRRQPHKVVPALGVHPWFAGTIRVATEESKAAHWGRVLTVRHPAPHHPLPKTRRTEEQHQTQYDDEEEELSIWVRSHLHLLPDPTPLPDLLADLRRRFERLPHAMMGEVGLDKQFLFRFDPVSPSPAATSSSSSSSPRMVQTQYKVTITHQLEVLRAQMELAVELHRPVSLHCVHAVSELQGLLDSLIARHGPRFTGLPASTDTQTHPAGINICWHSPTLSAEVQRQLLRRLPLTMYFSFSHQLARLHRPVPSPQPSADPLDLAQYSPRVLAAIQATPLNRLLLESDHAHPPRLIDSLLARIFRLCLLLRNLALPHPLSPLCLAQQIHHNWARFYALPCPNETLSHPS